MKILRASQSKPVGNLEKKNCNVTRPRHWSLNGKNFEDDTDLLFL